MRRIILVVAAAVLALSSCGATPAHTRSSATARPSASPTNRSVITGTPGDDHLAGTAGPDLIRGLAGSDEIHGRGGDDVIRGGEIGGLDTLFGGSGDDTIRLVNGGTVHAGPGDDTVRGVYLFVRSLIDCGPGRDHLYLTDTTRSNVTVRGCEIVTTTPIN